MCCTLSFLSPSHGQTGAIFTPAMENVKSAHGTFNVSFGENIPWVMDTPTPTTDDLVVKPGSAFLQQFSSSVMRAMNTLESTFSNKSSRTINIHCVFSVQPSMNIGASAEPTRSINTKSSYTAADFDGRFTGQQAYVNNLEHLWKYGLNLINTSPYTTDVTIYYYSPNESFGGFYVKESTADYRWGLLDVETVTLHEMGHAMGFNTGQGNAKSAMDLLVTSSPSSLPGGGMEYYFTGASATAANNGTQVRLMPGDNRFDAHIRKPDNCIMNDGTQNSGTTRQFTDVDLAMFQDMGWTLAVPEPASAGLAATAAMLLLLRRRQAALPKENSRRK